MTIIRNALRYAGHYILINILISWFVSGYFKGAALCIVGGAVALSFFISIIELLICSEPLFKIQTWCIRGSYILTGILIAVSFAGEKLFALFG